MGLEVREMSPFVFSRCRMDAWTAYNSGILFSASTAFDGSILAAQLIALIPTSPYLHTPVTEVAQCCESIATLDEIDMVLTFINGDL